MMPVVTMVLAWMALMSSLVLVILGSLEIVVKQVTNRLKFMRDYKRFRPTDISLSVISIYDVKWIIFDLKTHSTYFIVVIIVKIKDYRRLNS